MFSEITTALVYLLCCLLPRCQRQTGGLHSGTHPVPAGDLDPVLVHDADDAGRVEPGLAVGLHGHALVAEDADDDGAALRDPVPLQVHDARRSHVDRPEHRHHL